MSTELSDEAVAVLGSHAEVSVAYLRSELSMFIRSCEVKTRVSSSSDGMFFSAEDRSSRAISICYGNPLAPVVPRVFCRSCSVPPAVRDV